LKLLYEVTDVILGTFKYLNNHEFVLFSLLYKGEARENFLISCNLWPWVKENVRSLGIYFCSEVDKSRRVYF